MKISNGRIVYQGSRQLCLFVVALVALVSVGQEVQVVERGPHHRVVKHSFTERQPSGEVLTRSSSYTELATGMHYFSEGQWKQTQEEIEIINGSAVARKGPHQVIFAANLRSQGAIDMLSPDQKRFRSHVFGLAYTDAATGRSVLIAETKDCDGVLTKPNEVYYQDAFSGDCEADVRYTYTKRGFEQDIIIVKAPPSPANWGLNPETTRLEVLTEFDEIPAGQMRQIVLKGESDPQRRQQMVEPDLVDHILDFDVLKFETGQAFPVGQGTVFPEDGIQTAKSLEILEGRTFLIERVEYSAIRSHLAKLPQMAKAAPSRKPAPGRKAWAKIVPRIPAGTKGEWKKRQVAQSLEPRAGLVVDYITVNGSLTNYTFNGNSTYYVSGAVALYGTTTFSGGAVIKVKNNSFVNALELNGALDCPTDSFRPLIYTDSDDNTVGETIAGSTGNPTTNTVFSFGIGLKDTTSRYDVRNIHVRYAYISFAIYAGVKADFSNIQAIHGSRAVTFQVNVDVTWRNFLFADMLYGFNLGGRGTNRLEHGTFHRVGTFISNTSVSIWLTNCLLISVTNGVAYIGSNVATNLDDTGIFQTVGAGSYYLANNSQYRDAGTTNINPSLRTALAKRTTSPPILFEPTSTYTNNLNLVPQALRDSDTPDLGFHYESIDFVFSGFTLTNATISASNGVVIAGWSRGGHSLTLGNGATFVSAGTANNPNQIVRYNTVQEQFTTNWTDTTFGPLVQTLPDATNSPPSIQTRFTQWSILANDAHHLKFSTNDSGSHAFTHTEFHGGKFAGNRPSINSTNCLFNRVETLLSDGSGAYNSIHSFVNCTLFAGTNSLNRGGSGTWTFSDNLFDGVGIGQSGNVTADYNAYSTNGTRLSPTGAHDLLLGATVSYEPGTLGRFYLASSSPLHNAGSLTNAGLIGLFHFTSLTNQTKETNSVLNVGYHYIATDSLGVPIDYDGDSLADYLEDFDGDGAKGASESNWTVTDTDADGVGDYLEFLQSRNPNAGSVNDTNGVVELKIYTPLK